MEEKITFGKFMNQKRKEANLTQKELAEQIYVTESAVSKWERGISYPDITLVTAICEALHVTEHELITASEDLRQRRIEKQAKGFRTIKAAYSWTWYLLYGITIVTCFICNLAVNHTLSWFFIVLSSLAVSFSLTSVPVLVKKHRGLWTLGCCFVTLNLLLWVCQVFTGGNWFLTAFVSVVFGFSIVFLPLVLRELPLPHPVSSHKSLICMAADTVLLFGLVTVAVLYYGTPADLLTVAYPITVFFATIPWLFLAVIRYIPMNGLFKASACSFITGVYIFFMNSVLHTLIEHVPFALPQVNFRLWDDTLYQSYLNVNITFISSAAFIFVSLLFLIGGIVLTVKKPREK